ncbi:MAG TPA: type II toxin-antitoxin system RelE/ParE family toxin [Streptosporangiaceae bacterium]|nr:type II toxin-antitoxin system RelE/ParE family toxin [Streptosporangiaceae bacterium]
MRKLDQQVAGRVKAATEKLREEPRPPGAKMVTGLPGTLRIRVGDYRILYTIDDNQLMILVVDVGHRGAIYR